MEANANPTEHMDHIFDRLHDRLEPFLFLQLQMVLQSISWPQVKKQSDDGDDSDDVLEAETAAFSDNLHQLMRFWVGWEAPWQELKPEVVQSTGPNHKPTSSTCSERLRLPSHYSTYQALYADMVS